MRHLWKITLVLCAGLVGVAEAQNLLTNTGAETGDLSGWTVDLGNPEAASDCAGIGNINSTVDSGLYSFGMNQCDAAADIPDGVENPSQISQELDTTGCNVVTSVGELTGGTFQFSTRYLYSGNNQADFGISFKDEFGNTLESTNAEKSGNPDIYQDGMISGLIPRGASSAGLRLGGTALDGSNQPLVWHDNVSYEHTSCVAAYGVAAGKTTCNGGQETIDLGQGSQLSTRSECGGKNDTPTFTMVSPQGTIVFNGAVFLETQVGVMDGTGAGSPESYPYSGQMTVDSYVLLTAKQPRPSAWCLFTPEPELGSSVWITDEYWFLTDQMHFRCEDRSGTVIEGTWPVMLGQMNGTGGKGKDKDRGAFWLSFLEFELERGSAHTFEN